MKNCEFLYTEAKQKLVDLVKTNKIPLDKICLFQVVEIQLLCCIW